MHIKHLTLSVLAVLIAISLIRDNMYTKRMISGKYSYNFPLAMTEGPNQGDKLILKEDGTFNSDSWGVGTYSIQGTELELKYNYEFGQGEYTMTIYRPYFWGQLRFSVVRDLNYYFQKND